MTSNFFPYPPLFHLALATTLSNPYLYARVLQVLFLPCTFALTLWLVYKHGNSKAAAITGIVLFSCWSFWDGALQVRPQSLDLLFYPLIVLALLETKKKTFSALSLATIYSHGIAPLSAIYGLTIPKLREKTWHLTLLLSALAIIPILAISVYYVPGAFKMWGPTAQSANPQEYMFWNAPHAFIPVYAGATLIGIPFMFKRGKSQFETLLCYGIIGSLIMLPIWADRWLQYISIPLACLAGLGISRMEGKKLALTGIFLMSFLLFYLYYFLMLSVFHAWWQP